MTNKKPSKKSATEKLSKRETEDLMDKHKDVLHRKNGAYSNRSKRVFH